MNPNTLVHIKVFIPKEEPVERTVKISNIEHYLKDGLRIQVDSPHGWVDVVEFSDVVKQQKL